jgi:membrane protease YdiL (CAAX protease family)
MPGTVDVVLVAVLVVVVPLGAMWERRRLERDLAAGLPRARLAAYGRIVLMEWGMAVVLLVVWAVAGRELALLGVTRPGGRGFGIAAAIAVAVMILLAMQFRAVRRRPELAAQVRAAAAPVAFMLPATPAELRRFNLLSLTAGVVEELFYRGYLMWCLGAFVPTWLALLVSSLLFGIGHAYQGPTGIAKTGAAGLFLGALYWLSGSLWIPIIVHGLIDAVNGRMAYEVAPSTEVLAGRSLPGDSSSTA